MAAVKQLLFFVLIIINCTKCESSRRIHKRMEAAHNIISRETYEDTQNDVLNDFELEKFMYPRGDKHKLTELSQAWREYYACTTRQLRVMTGQQLPNVVLMVYKGSAARLPCALCSEPGAKSMLTWMYAPTMDRKDSQPVQNYDRLTVNNGVMIIYNVIQGDEGAYWCHRGAGSGGLVLIEVVDREKYIVVKPSTSRGPHAVAPEPYEGIIILFSQWYAWSECSVCGRVGRRHRHGMCYIKPDPVLITRYEADPVGTTNSSKIIELDDKFIQLFQAFPGGLPCRSQYLPNTLKNLDVINQRPSEIMIGMCKVPCEKKTDDASDQARGGVHVNGSVFYSLGPSLPKQPPLPVRNTIFADFGQPYAIRCPGTTLRDVPIVWRVGTKHLVPRDVDKCSGGRVHLNSRDHLVFTIVLYEDQNLYSCWQRDYLAGTVKLVVWAGERARWTQHAALLLVVLAAALLLRVASRALRSVQRTQPMLYRIH